MLWLNWLDISCLSQMVYLLSFLTGTGTQWKFDDTEHTWQRTVIFHCQVSLQHKRPKGEKMTTNCAPPPQTIWVWYQLSHGFGKDEKTRDFFFFLPAFVFSSYSLFFVKFALQVAGINSSLFFSCITAERTHTHTLKGVSLLIMHQKSTLACAGDLQHCDSRA